MLNFRISTKDLKYNYHVGCPHVIFESGYEMKGDLGPKFVEGKGTCKVDHCKYFKYIETPYLLNSHSDKLRHGFEIGEVKICLTIFIICAPVVT